MSAVRLSAICLGSLILIAPTLARPGPGDEVGMLPASAPANDKPTLEKPVDGRAAGGRAAGDIPPGAAIGRGAGGVGFGAPHREDQLDALKEILEAGDEAWKKLSPKVEKVLAAKADMNTGAGMNWTRSNNARPVYKPSAAQPDTVPGKAMQDVRDAAANKDASDQALAEKMAAVRAARKQARGQYEAAEKALIAALTPRQQAILMTLGVVE
jgi:hypothetical protein